MQPRILAHYITIGLAAFLTNTAAQSLKLMISEPDYNRNTRYEFQSYRLNVIRYRNTISILDVDYAHLKPSYLTEFCKEIRTIMSENHGEPNYVIHDKTAEKFREVAYKPYNFPYTYRDNVAVVVTADDFAKYNKLYCNSPTNYENIGAFLGIIIITGAILCLTSH